jgi:hypothetical protein
MRTSEMRLCLRGTVQASHPDRMAVTLALKSTEEQFNLTKLVAWLRLHEPSGC